MFSYRHNEAVLHTQQCLGSINSIADVRWKIVNLTIVTNTVMSVDVRWKREMLNSLVTSHQRCSFRWDPSRTDVSRSSEVLWGRTATGEARCRLAAWFAFPLDDVNELSAGLPCLYSPSSDHGCCEFSLLRHVYTTMYRVGQKCKPGPEIVRFTNLLTSWKRL